jgi:extracellular elastinolytic metalloproteinase
VWGNSLSMRTHSLVLAAVLVVLSCADVHAQPRPGRDFDLRSLSEETPRPTQLQLAAEERLRTQVHSLRVVYEATFGTARSVSAVSEGLTQGSAGKPEDIARKFIADNIDLLGLRAIDLAEMELHAVMPGISQSTHLAFRQRLHNIPVYNGLIQVAVTADGRVLALQNSAVPIPTGDLHANPVVRARQASKATLMWLPFARKELRLVWNIEENHHTVNVDARSGNVLTSFDRKFDASYRVYTRPIESPSHSLRVVYEATFGTARSVSAVSEGLTQGSAGKPEDIARKFIADNIDLLGLRAIDLAEMEVHAAMPGVSKSTHLAFRQRIHDIPVYNGLIQVAVTADGRVLALQNSAVPIPTGDLHANPVVRAPQASKATLMWLPFARKDLRLVWNFEENHHNVNVDARSGKVLTSFDRKFDASYRVYTRPIESPSHSLPPSPADGRRLVGDPFDPIASPLGWHFTDGLLGNNASVYVDHFNLDTPPATLTDCGPARRCDFPLNLLDSPLRSIDAASTNVFYWTNVFHDVMWHHLFDPPSGAFQGDNFGLAGMGNDPVYAEIQNGWGTGTELLCTDDFGVRILCRNNASFTMVPDGVPGRLELELWTPPFRDRDGSLDSLIIVHELAHGLTGRLLGAPASATCVGRAPAITEGISDFFGLAFTHNLEDGPSTPRPIATYGLGQPVFGRGLREEPYSLDPRVNSSHHERHGDCLEVFTHCQGQVFAQLLWGIYWDLVTEWGFSLDLAVEGGTGNQRMLSYMVDALKSTRCEPEFVDAAEGLRTATRFPPVDRCIVLRRLGRFGLGTDVVGRTSTFNPPANGHGVPTECLGPYAETALSNPDAHPGDAFGNAVVIRGDTAIVGATHASNEHGVHAGAAYIFLRAPSGWVLHAKLTGPDGADGDRFGAAVDLKGDFAIIGAPGRENPDGRGADHGGAYVFHRMATPTGPQWEQEGQEIKLWTPHNEEHFGFSVAINSRRKLAVIGAPGVDGGDGIAVVFKQQSDGHSGHEWVPIGDRDFARLAVLRASPRAAGALFGHAVAFSIDGETIFVGAPGDDTLAVDGGSAHLFERSRTARTLTFVHVARLGPRSPAANGEYGFSVALGVDLGVTGNPPLAIVGAPGTDSSSGLVYIYTRPDTGWADGVARRFATPAHWSPDHPLAALNDRFGTSVDISGDLLAVGAPGDRASSGLGLGSGFVFERTRTGWFERNRLRRGGFETHDGATVSISASVVVVGALDATDSGSIFFYE